ncbi:hypothetical protein B5F07_07930 [Lachnoclostridium sp. An169]|nr:hypothetical protein B5F07_07930 [Lachnoclostridium sp. An169]
MTVRERRTNSLRMTEGSEIRNILIFMIPLLIGNIFQQLYNFVDSVVVGRFISAQALGYWSVWVTAIFSSMLAASLCIWRYRSGKWMKKAAV